MERILDAASHLFAASGYDAATTEAIAERAGTSIGSVYQFFPNKLAIFNAIALRYVSRVRELFNAFTMPAGRVSSAPWYDLLDGTIDAFAAFHKREPGFQAILLNWRISADMVLANDDVNREFAKRAEQVLAPLVPTLSPARRALVSTMIIETISAMLILCARRGDAFGDAVIVETKTMLRRYLEPIVTEHAGPPARPKAGRKSAASAKK